MPYRILYCCLFANLPVALERKPLPLEKLREEPNEFLFEEPKERLPPNDLDPNDLPPPLPKPDLASIVTGITVKESMHKKSNAYVCLMNADIKFLRKWFQLTAFHQNF
jgi:hypothetical protein